MSGSNKSLLCQSAAEARATATFQPRRVLNATSAARRRVVIIMPVIISATECGRLLSWRATWRRRVLGLTSDQTYMHVSSLNISQSPDLSTRTSSSSVSNTSISFEIGLQFSAIWTLLNFLLKLKKSSLGKGGGPSKCVFFSVSKWYTISNSPTTKKQASRRVTLCNNKFRFLRLYDLIGWKARW